MDPFPCVCYQGDSRIARSVIEILLSGSTQRRRRLPYLIPSRLRRNPHPFRQGQLPLVAHLQHPAPLAGGTDDLVAGRKLVVAWLPSQASPVPTCEDLEEIHARFRDFVHERRAKLDMEK